MAKDTNGLGRDFLRALVSDIEVTIQPDNQLYDVAMDLSTRGLVSLVPEKNRIRVSLMPYEGGLYQAVRKPENATYIGVLLEAGVVKLCPNQRGRWSGM